MEKAISESVYEKLQKGHVELARGNELFSRVSGMKRTLQDAEAQFKDVFGLEDYLNPFHKSPDLENLMDHIKENLIKFLAARVAEVREVVDVEEVYKEFKDKDFNAFAIRDFVKERYDGRADELALESLEEAAGRLVPYTWQDEKRKPAEIRDGRKLKLRCYLDWGLGGRPLNLYELCDRLMALERFARVVVNGMKPGVAIGFHPSVGPRYYRMREELLKKQEFIAGVIRTTKLHKNGSLYVWLGNEGDARKLADALRRASTR